MSDERRHLRAVREPAPPEEPHYARKLPRGDRTEPPIPVVAVLGQSPAADVPGMVAALLRALRARSDRPALLWSERTDTLPAGVVTTASSAMLFPDALREAAGLAHLARIAHLGAGAEAEAGGRLFAELEDCTHAILDGRLLGVVKAHVAVLVTTDDLTPPTPEAEALRRDCDVEVYQPTDTVAVALLRSLDRRA